MARWGCFSSGRAEAPAVLQHAHMGHCLRDRVSWALTRR